MNTKNEVTPIEIETSRTAAVNLLFECTKNLLFKTRMTDQLETDLFEDIQEVMPIDRYSTNQ